MQYQISQIMDGVERVVRNFDCNGWDKAVGFFLSYSPPVGATVLLMVLTEQNYFVIEEKVN